MIRVSLSMVSLSMVSLSIERTVVQFHLRHFEARATSFILLCLCFSEDTKSSWSLLSGQGSKRSHVGKWKKPVMDSLTLSAIYNMYIDNNIE